MQYVFLLGRILFSSIFILKSLDHFSETTVDRALLMGLPMAQLFVPAAGILAFLGGVSILLGYKAKIGAWLLVIFLLPTAFVMHKFWQAGEPFSVMMQQYCFWKNISMLGAALMITYFGSGPMSLDRK